MYWLKLFREELGEVEGREKKRKRKEERERKREGETEKSRYRHCLRNRISRERKWVDLAEYWDVPSMTP